jgi:hypothetical protein
MEASNAKGAVKVTAPKVNLPAIQCLVPGRSTILHPTHPRDAMATKPAIDLHNWFESEVTRASHAAHNAMFRDPSPFYLYYRIGGLALFTDMETDEAVKAGWILATPQAFRGFDDRDTMRRKVRAIAGSLPCLPS